MTQSYGSEIKMKVSIISVHSIGTLWTLSNTFVCCPNEIQNLPCFYIIFPNLLCCNIVINGSVFVHKSSERC